MLQLKDEINVKCTVSKEKYGNYKEYVTKHFNSFFYQMIFFFQKQFIKIFKMSNMQQLNDIYWHFEFGLFFPLPQKCIRWIMTEIQYQCLCYQLWML